MFFTKHLLSPNQMIVSSMNMWIFQGDLWQVSCFYSQKHIQLEHVILRNLWIQTSKIFQSPLIRFPKGFSPKVWFHLMHGNPLRNVWAKKVFWEKRNSTQTINMLCGLTCEHLQTMKLMVEGCNWIIHGWCETWNQKDCWRLRKYDMSHVCDCRCKIGRASCRERV